MKKRILSVLLALVMVIGLLPIAVFAADLTDDQKADLIKMGYTEEDLKNVMVLDEDTTIEEDYDGLVVVAVSGIKVTVNGVKLSTGLAVLPIAAEAKVAITGKAEVNAVIVMGEKAEVTSSAESSISYVTVAAAEVKADIAAAGKVTVEEAGAKADVKVAKADSVVNKAPEAKLDVKEAVTVENNGDKAEVKVAKATTVSNSGVSAKLNVTEATTVSNNGANAEIKADKVGTVVNDGQGAKIDAPNSTVTDNTAGLTEPTQPTQNAAVPGDTSSSQKGFSVIAANLTKKDEDAQWPSGGQATSYSVTTSQVKDVKVTDKENPASDLEAEPTAAYNVVVRAEKLEKHPNGAEKPVDGYWVGIGIPVQLDEEKIDKKTGAPKDSEFGSGYKYFVMTIDCQTQKDDFFNGKIAVTDTEWTIVNTVPGRYNQNNDGTYTHDGNTYYNTIYMDVGTDIGVNDVVIAVQKGDDAAESKTGDSTTTITPADVLEFLYVSFEGSTTDVTKDEETGKVTATTDTKYSGNGSVTTEWSESVEGEKTDENGETTTVTESTTGIGKFEDGKTEDKTVTETKVTETGTGKDKTTTTTVTVTEEHTVDGEGTQTVTVTTNGKVTSTTTTEIPAADDTLE